MKLEDNISGMPNQIIIRYYSRIGFIVRPGDKVRVQGELYHEKLLFWNKDFSWIAAHHIFNETLGCGF